jgi:hypothetical protein
LAEALRDSDEGKKLRNETVKENKELRLTFLNIFLWGQKSGLVVSILNSQFEFRGFESHSRLDGNGVKAMPGSIPATNSGSFNNWKEIKYR